MFYKCQVCKYKTDSKSNYDKHLQSKKHINNIAENFICEFCEYATDKQNNLEKHYEKCKTKEIVDKYVKLSASLQKEKNDNDKKIIDAQIIVFEKQVAKLNLENQLLKKDKEIMSERIVEKDKLLMEKDKTLQSYIESKNKDSDFIKNIATTAGTVAEKSVDAVNKTAEVAKQSMSALTFIQTHYNNAPVLEAPKKWLTHLKPIEKIEITDSDRENEDIYDDEYFKIEKKNRLMKEIDTTSEDNFVRKINGNKSKLYEEIGDIILESIKKDNPENQSVWCSDVARLSYLIRDLVDKNKNVAEWKVDKNGKKMCELLIVPLIDEIKIIAKDFMQRSFLKIFNRIGDDVSHMNMNTEITELLNLLCNKTLTNQIKKYVAGDLYLNKNEAVIV